MRTRPILHYLSVVYVGLFFVSAIAGPMVAPYSPEELDLRAQYLPPSAAHWFGTGDNGIDLLSAILHGARLAAFVGVFVVALSLLIGAAIGVISGYFGRRIDETLMAMTDLVQAFPSLVLNLAILSVVAQPGVVHVVFALVASGWVLYARLSRAEALRLRNYAFVESASALGYSEARIVFRHILPNVAPALIVQATAGFGAAVLAESTLSFLGLGPGKATSWGAMLDQGTGVLLRYPHVALFSGAAIALTVLSFNLTGDFLRDRWQ